MTIYLIDDAFSVKAKRFNKMFTSILALFCLLRIANRSHFYGPSFIESHYGQNTKILLRQLEAVSKKIVKREADVEFLINCVTNRLQPKFLRFKLYKKEKHESKRVISLKKKFLLTEIRQHCKALKKLKTTAEEMHKGLNSSIGYLSRIYEQRFIKKKTESAKRTILTIHKRKLKNLGLDIGLG